MFNGQRRDVYFGYSSRDNLPLNVKFGTSSAYKVTNTYDELTRLSEKQYTVVGESAVLKTEYSYLNFSGNRTTGTVKGIDYTYVEGGLTTYNRWYDYDGIGNIVAEYERKDGKITARERYVYDAKNQLVRHNSATQKCTITYSYDAGGDITKHYKLS